MRLGILGAMESEVALLCAAIENDTVETVAGTAFHHGTLAGQDVVVVQCGIGKVCAAVATQILIDRYHVDGIVNTGVAGGIAPALAVGDLVVATGALQHDFDITAFGHARGYMPAMGGDNSHASVYPTDPALSDAFRAAAQRVREQEGGRFTCHSGVVASGDVFVNSAALRSTLRDEFSATAAEMEGAAAAQAAYLNGVPFALIRAISDLADGSADVSFEQFERETAALGSRILIEMLAAM